MPLLDPKQIHAVLRDSLPPTVRADKSDLALLLERANLSPEEVLDQLANIVRGGETEGNRLRATEMALKLNGMLTPDDNRDMTVIINIQDSQFSEINPILIPR